LGWCLVVGAGLGIAAASARLFGGGGVAASALGWTGAETAAAVIAVTALILFDLMVYDLNARGRVLDGPVVNLGRAALFLGTVVVLVETVVEGSDWRPVLMAYAAAQAVAAVAVLVRARGEAARSGGVAASGSPRPGAGSHALLGRLLKRGWVGQLSSVVSLLHLRLDLALVAYWHGVGVVGVYSVAVLVGELLWLISGALQPVLVYTASAGDDPRGRDRTTARAVRLGLSVTALAGAVLWFLAPYLFDLLFGAPYAGSTAALRALLPGIVVFSAGAVLAGDFIGRGRAVWNTQASLLTVVVNIAAGVWLIPAHGALGAAWASTIAYIDGTLVMLLRFRAAATLGWGDIFRPRISDFTRS